MIDFLEAPMDIPPTCEGFLRSLKGPTGIRIRGEDTSRTRVLVTLSHGNEPSGFQVLYEWLQSGCKPLVNILVILGGVKAAQFPPLFFYRYLPGQRDLNRCFMPPYKGNQGKLAQAMLESIYQCQPEAVVDMHNTTSFTSAFSVCFGESLEKRALASHFADTLIVSHLQMGSLMEQTFHGPVITVEVGGSEDPESFTVATQGIKNYFLKENLLAPSPRKVVTLYNPLRLELSRHKKVGYSQKALKDHDITLRVDIESLNFKTVGVNEWLGWVEVVRFTNLRIRDSHQMKDASIYFTIRQGKLYPKAPMTLFMATQRVDIATSDCLFYFVNFIE